MPRTWLGLLYWDRVPRGPVPHRRDTSGPEPQHGLESEVLESVASYATRAEETFCKISNPWSLDTFVQYHKNKLLEKRNLIMQNVNSLTTLWMLQQYRTAIQISKCSFSVSVPVSLQIISKQTTF